MVGKYFNNRKRNMDSEDAARFFFNSGGQIRIRYTQPNGTSQDTAWQTIFSNIGTITISANASSRNGTAGTVSSSGYYQMPATSTLMFNGANIGSGAYATNDVLVYVNRLSYTGTNGGNGVGFAIQTTLQDDHTGTVDSVAAGTTKLIDVYRCTSTLSGIAAPTISTSSAWA